MSYIYVLDSKYSDSNRFSDVMYSISKREIEDAIKRETKYFHPDNENALSRFLRVRQIIPNKHSLEGEMLSSQTDYYAPNGQKLMVSPLDVYHVQRGLCRFQWESENYVWNGLEWELEDDNN